MSTLGSMLISLHGSEQHPAHEAPHAVGDPRVADHVGLHGESEHGPECTGHPGDRRAAAGAGRRDEADQHGETPGEPECGAQQAGLGADLGVVRLARLQLRPGARGGLPRVAKTEALGVVDHRPNSLLQVGEVAPDRRLAVGDRASRGRALLLRDLVLIDEIGLGPVPRRPDLREHGRPADPDRDDRKAAHGVTERRHLAHALVPECEGAAQGEKTGRQEAVDVATGHREGANQRLAVGLDVRRRDLAPLELVRAAAGELLHAAMLARTRQPRKRSIRIRACMRASARASRSTPQSRSAVTRGS